MAFSILIHDLPRKQPKQQLVHYFFKLALSLCVGRAKNKEQRENVISELVVTERDFCRDLKLTWQAFGLDTPDMLEQRGVDVGALFGNLSDVIDVSLAFLDTLQEEVKSKSSSCEQMVGR